MQKTAADWLGEQIFSQAEIDQAVTNLAQKIDQDYLDRPEDVVVIGIMRGAFIFLSDLVQKMQTMIDIDFITTRSYGKSTESSGEIELLADLQVDIKGKHVIVVDDIVDTGQTFMFLDVILRHRQPASLEFCALFDKPERRHPDFDLQIKYIGQRVPNKFIAGYGLDGAHLGRNLNGIYTLKSES